MAEPERKPKSCDSESTAYLNIYYCFEGTIFLLITVRCFHLGQEGGSPGSKWPYRKAPYKPVPSGTGGLPEGWNSE